MIAIFGESKAGEFNKLFSIKTLPDLATHLGEPTETGVAIHMAIQALLCKQQLLFYKVREEGGHSDQYLPGFKLIKTAITAIALPGVSSPTLLESAKRLAPLLILTEQDLYDFMTQSP